MHNENLGIIYVYSDGIHLTQAPARVSI